MLYIWKTKVFFFLNKVCLFYWKQSFFVFILKLTIVCYEKDKVCKKKEKFVGEKDSN